MRRRSHPTTCPVASRPIRHEVDRNRDARSGSKELRPQNRPQVLSRPKSRHRCPDESDSCRTPPGTYLPTRTSVQIILNAASGHLNNVVRARAQGSTFDRLWYPTHTEIKAARSKGLTLGVILGGVVAESSLKPSIPGNVKFNQQAMKLPHKPDGSGPCNVELIPIS